MLSFNWSISQQLFLDLHHVVDISHSLFEDLNVVVLIVLVVVFPCKIPCTKQYLKLSP